jgi:hypothetical protein
MLARAIRSVAQVSQSALARCCLPARAPRVPCSQRFAASVVTASRSVASIDASRMFHTTAPPMQGEACAPSPAPARDRFGSQQAA